MNTMLNKGLRTLTCGTAALVITVVMSLSFIQSTAVVHDGVAGFTPQVARLWVQPSPSHTWFGQPEPAALVD